MGNAREENRQRDLAKKLRKIARQQRLAEEAQFGRPRSKSWDRYPSKKKERRKTKLDLKEMIKRNDYEGN